MVITVIVADTQKVREYYDVTPRYASTRQIGRGLKEDTNEHR
jgi:hypothetical protein